MSPYYTSNMWAAWQMKCGRHPSSSRGSSLKYLQIFKYWRGSSLMKYLKYFQYFHEEANIAIFCQLLPFQCILVMYVWSFMKPLKRRTSGWRCSKGMNSMFSSNGWIVEKLNQSCCRMLLLLQTSDFLNILTQPAFAPHSTDRLWGWREFEFN